MRQGVNARKNPFLRTQQDLERLKKAEEKRVRKRLKQSTCNMPTSDNNRCNQEFGHYGSCRTV